MPIIRYRSLPAIRQASTWAGVIGTVRWNEHAAMVRIDSTLISHSHVDERTLCGADEVGDLADSQGSCALADVLRCDAVRQAGAVGYDGGASRALVAANVEHQAVAPRG
jgi:hypothetical protein